MTILSQDMEIGTLDVWWQSNADIWIKKASPETWLLTVHSKRKTITPRFHENGHWLVVENSIYFESNFISNLMERHPMASISAHAPKLPSI